MAIEIERKFLVRGAEWRKHATSQNFLRQAYLASGERSSTRVRIANNADATVTIKSKKAEMRRLEIEYPVSVPDAEALMALRYSGLIEKTRFTVPWQGARGKWTSSRATTAALSSPSSNSATSQSPSLTRRGWALRLPANLNTTMARWQDGHSASGLHRRLKWPSAELADNSCSRQPGSATTFGV